MLRRIFIVPGMADGEWSKIHIELRRHRKLKASVIEVLNTISIIHCSSHSLHHLPLFPDGQDGLYPKRKIGPKRRVLRNKINPTMLYSLYFFQHENEFSCIWQWGRSMQPYVVNQFCRTEVERQSHLRERQGQLRAPDYRRLRELPGDSGRTEDGPTDCFFFRRPILMGSNICSKKCTIFVAISNKIGQLDFFESIACSPT